MFWKSDFPGLSEEFIMPWRSVAEEIKNIKLNKFVKMLKRYLYGIVSHSVFQINNARLEGINNKIKVNKRRAYGYWDFQYFALKIMQATTN